MSKPNDIDLFISSYLDSVCFIFDVAFLFIFYIRHLLDIIQENFTATLIMEPKCMNIFMKPCIIDDIFIRNAVIA